MNGRDLFLCGLCVLCGEYPLQPAQHLQNAPGEHEEGENEEQGSLRPLAEIRDSFLLVKGFFFFCFHLFQQWFFRVGLKPGPALVLSHSPYTLM